MCIRDSGLPLAYLAPATLGYLLESPEDRGRDYVLASCIRILRYGALLTGLLLPAIYIAFVSFHQDWIPQQLLNIDVYKRQVLHILHRGLPEDWLLTGKNRK